MLDWIFEGAATWVSSIMTQLMDAVSGLFLEALGTDMTAMEEYFPFAVSAYTVIQYAAWALLFLVVAWQLFRAFGGPLTEAENPLQLLARSAIFAFLIAYAKPVFCLLLDIARAPYTALMDETMAPDDFTFAGIQQALTNGLTTIVSVATVVGLILLIIMMIALAWNYFKLLLETVERYVLVGVLCYTSPLAYAMGASKATSRVFQSWCRMVGSQLLLLVLNVWFLRAFDSSVGQFIGNGGALSGGKGSIFLWLFCALALLKIAQRCDSYLSALGLSVAQTGSSMGMEMLMAARVLTGSSKAGTSAGAAFSGAGKSGSAATGGTAGAANGAGGILSGFVSRYKPNSFVRDAVVNGGSRMGAGGSVGFVGRTFGGMAARGGATLTADSVSSVASRPSKVSGTIAGDIADRSLSNYMPHLSADVPLGSMSYSPPDAGNAGPTFTGTPPVEMSQAADQGTSNPVNTVADGGTGLAGFQFSNTEITGGHISTTAIGPDGQQASVDLYSKDQYERPDSPYTLVTAADGSQWYQMATGEGAGAFYATPAFTGDASEAGQVAEAFPSAPDGTLLRRVEDGVMEASYADGGSGLWYSSAFYQEPDAPHETLLGSNGLNWYAMTSHASTPQFEAGQVATAYNQALFGQFMPGFDQPITSIDSSRASDGMLEVRHEDGSGTMFYDRTRYQAPRGDYHVFEDSGGGQWYAIPGAPAVERRPVYEDSKPVYENGEVQTMNVETVRYKATPTRYSGPKARSSTERRPPKKKT